MKRKEIFLVVILILFGFLVKIYESGGKVIFEGCSVDNRSLQDRMYPHDIMIEESRFEKIESLEIINPAGEIRINPSIDGSVVVKAIKRIFHRHEQKVADIQGKIKIALKPIGGVLKIDVETPGRFPFNRARIIFHISVPGSTGLKLVNRYGGIVINEAGSGIRVDEKYGDLNLRDIHSDLNIIHGYGYVMIDSVEGNLEMDTKYSKVNISDTRDIGIRGWHAKLQLAGIKGDVVVANSHDKIDLRDIKGRININGRHCPISLRNIDSGFLLIKNSHLEVDIENLWAEKVDVSLENGDLKIRFFDIKNQMNISNKHSNITMIYSDAMNPSFNINLTYGKLINETPLELNVFSGKVKKIYTGGRGAPEITITNRYGDILLRHSEYRGLNSGVAWVHSGVIPGCFWY